MSKVPNKPPEVNPMQSQSLALLRQQAVERHARYPQYAGYFDGWRLAVVTRNLRSKGGVSALRGERVLASPEAHEDARGPELVGFRTFYSTRLGWNCLVPADALRFV
jgi:hypothetical protein